MIYRPRYNQVGAMTDSKACRAAFGHYDLNCPRCLQLKRGASPQLENEAQSAPARLHLVKRRPMNTITITVGLENEEAWAAGSVSEARRLGSLAQSFDLG